VNTRIGKPRAVRTLRSALFLVVASLVPQAAQAWPFWMTLPEQVSTYAAPIDDMFHLIMWITGIVFVIVEGILLFFVWKYRHREGRQVHYTHGNNRVEVVWTIVPALICVLLALLSRRLWEDIKQHMPKDALQVQVTGEQFAWNFRYAGRDGAFGRTAPRFVSRQNPRGMDQSDAAGRDDIIVSELRLPVNEPVVVLIRSSDVIHSLFLPNFRVKQDAVPGMTTQFWFTPTRRGNFELACAELCGVGHYIMRGRVVVETKAAFDAWLAQQSH